MYFPLPEDLDGDVLLDALNSAGLSATEILVEGDQIRIPDLGEEYRDAAAAVVAAHASQVRAAAQRQTMEQSNKEQLTQQGVAALQQNRDFLDLSSPTNAQVLTQVRALTRQSNGLIRLVLGRLDSID